MKPFVLRSILKQKKLIIFTINLVIVLSFLSHFLSFNKVQAVWLGMDRANTIDNLSNNSGDSWGPQIQLDSQSNLYIVWADESAGNGDIFFKKWTPGVGWTKMDGTAGYDNLSANSGVSKEPHISLDSANRPYVVWSDNTTLFNYDIYFSKWTPGTGWTQMDGTTPGSENLSNTSGDSDYVVMQLDSANIPYIVWRDATTGITDIYFTKWTPGTGWTGMDGVTPGYENLSNNSEFSTFPKLKIDANNNPLVLWEDYTTGNGDIYLNKWTPGTGWTQMDGTLGYDNLSNNAGDSIYSNIDIDAANNPYAIWADRTSGNQEIYFTKWTPSVGWTQMDGTPGLDNLSNNSGHSIMPQIFLDTANKPYVSWTDETTGFRDIYFSKWTFGTGWTGMDGVTLGYDNISNNSGASVLPKILLDSADRSYIVWHDDDDSPDPWVYDVFFTKWTLGTGWTQMDGVTLGYENISNNSGQSAYSEMEPNMELNNVNFPYIVWHDDTEGNLEIYFTRWLLEEQGQIIISASVDPSLTLSLTATVCNLGTFDFANIKTCNYGTQVTTNASAGYTAYVRTDGNLRNATNSIADASGATVTAGTEGYGVSTTASAQSITKINDANSDGNYTQADCLALDNQGSIAMTASVLTTDDQSLASVDAPTSADTVYLCHAVGITGTTEAGSYSQIVTITVVGNF